MLQLFGNLQQSSVEHPATTKAGHNAIMTSMIVCSGFVVCWSYGEIAYYIRSMGVYVDMTSWFYHFNSLLLHGYSTLTHFINWLLPLHSVLDSSVQQPRCSIYIEYHHLVLPLQQCIWPQVPVLTLSDLPNLVCLQSWFHHFGVVIRFTNSCINPFIYAAKYGEFQKGVRRMAAHLVRKSHQIQPQHNTAVAVISKPTSRQT